VYLVNDKEQQADAMIDAVRRYMYCRPTGSASGYNVARHVTGEGDEQTSSSAVANSAQLDAYLPIRQTLSTTVQPQTAGCQRGPSLSMLATHCYNNVTTTHP